MDKFFHLKENGTNIKTEVIGGIVTFFAMSYILAVNPSIISFGGTVEPILHSVFFATCISAAIGTLLMGLYANLPFAQAPGMGLNAFFAFTVMSTMGAISGVEDPIAQYQMALALVLISGLLFIFITVIGLRESIVDAIPMNIKIAMGGGIGLFITFLGLQNSGLVIASPATMLSLANFTDLMTPASNGTTSMGALVAIFGVILIASLSALKVRGAVIIGIIASTALAYLTGAATFNGLDWNIGLQMSTWVETSLFKFDFATIFSNGDILGAIVTIIVLVLSLSMVDLFESIGTFLGTANKTGFLDEDGNMKDMKKALMCDAIATTAGACLGTSTVTTYVESAAGVGEGARTGLASVVTGICFIIAIFLSPVILLVPACATAPALIYVGFLMLSSVTKMDFDDITEGIPGFLTIAMMSFSYSVANGIAFGLISYVLLKLFSGKIKEIKVMTVIIAILFLLKYFVEI